MQERKKGADTAGENAKSHIILMTSDETTANETTAAREREKSEKEIELREIIDLGAFNQQLVDAKVKKTTGEKANWPPKTKKSPSRLIRGSSRE